MGKSLHTSVPAPLCPVKFMPMRSIAHFTGVAPADGTGVNNVPEVAPE